MYAKTGWKKNLKSLNQGRGLHGCTSFVAGGKKVNSEKIKQKKLKGKP